MTSKNLFFKLMKKDLMQRIWALALIGLGSFFAYPVSAAIAARDISHAQTMEIGLGYYTRSMAEWLSFENGMTAFLMTIAALICGISSFSWLNSRSKVDFYHSIPVRREKLFAVNFVDGILILAIPYVIAMAAAAAVAVGYGADKNQIWPVAVAACGLHLTYFILMYTTVVTAVMMTGNMVVAFLGCVVFSAVVPMITALSENYFQLFFHTAVWDNRSWLAELGIRMSPVVEYFVQTSRYMDGDPMALSVAAALIISAALAVLSCVLYRKRPSEAAGKAMSFAVTKPVIRLVIVMLSSLGMAAVFWDMMESTGWSVFGILCGAVISHCTVEAIYHFDFRRLFAHPKQLVGCVVAALAVFFIFRYDMLGYDEYLPAAGKVKSAAVEFVRASDWVDYGYTKEEKDGTYIWETPKECRPLYTMSLSSAEELETVLNIAAAGIEETNTELVQAETSVGREEEPPSLQTYFIVRYTLKSGRQVSRRYSLNVEKCYELLETLYQDRNYQNATFPLLTRTAESVCDVRWRGGDGADTEVCLNLLEPEAKSELLETYKREFSGLTISRMEQELPVGLIRFTTDSDVAGMRWKRVLDTKNMEDYTYNQYRKAGYYGMFEESGYYPVYPSFEETIRLLSQYQIKAGSYYDNKAVMDIDVYWYGDDGSTTEMVITDPQQLEQMKRVMGIPGMSHYNQLFLGTQLDIIPRIREGGEWDGAYSFSVPAAWDQVPDFVWRGLEENAGQKSRY
ncbi:MAG: DUF6449 domain-containing protein [Eubacteriales bacterium]|nr:DUF6449 domain-containing protein [Eubacteriales bacterium]